MLKKYIKKNYKSQEEFANKIGIHRQTLISIIKDKSPFITISTVIKIWNETGLSPYDYLKDLPDMIKSHRKLMFKS